MPNSSNLPQSRTSTSTQGSSNRPLRTLRSAQNITPTINPNLLTGIGTQYSDHHPGPQDSYDYSALDATDFSNFDLPPVDASFTSTAGLGLLSGDDFWHYNASAADLLLTGCFNTTGLEHYQHLQHHGQPVSHLSHELCRQQRLPLAQGHTSPSPSLHQVMPLSPVSSSSSFSSTATCWCNNCGTGFKRKKDKDRHVKTKHGDKTFRCNFCGQIKPRSDRLQASCRLRHPNQAPQIVEIDK